MWFLRQATASQEIPLGPFVDSTDGNTAETGLTIANTDIKLQKTGATSQANKNSGGATHIANGDYYTTLDATDTNTIGPMRVKVHVAGALPVWLDCCVLDEAVYDVMFGTTAPSTYAGADTSGTTTLLSRIGGALTISGGRVDANVTYYGGSAGTFASGLPAVNATQISGSATAADNVEVVFATDFATNYNTTRDKWQVEADVLALSGDSAAADNAESFFDGTGYAGTNNVIPTVTVVTNLTNAPTSGDFTATMKTSIGTAVAASAVASVTGNVGGNVVGSIGSLATQAKADVNAECDTALADAKAGYAAAIEAAILDEGDATALLAAIAAKVEEFLINEGDASATLAAIAAAVRTNLATELGRIDAAISSRAPSATALSTAQWTNTLATNLGTLAGHDPGSTLAAASDVADLQTHGDGEWATADVSAVALETTAQAIKARTDNLPDDPADQSLVIAATDAIMSRLGTPAATVSADIAAVKSDTAAVKIKTDNLPNSPAAVGSQMNLADSAITDAKISTPAENAGRPAGILGMIRRIFEKMPGGNKQTRDRSTGTVTLRNAADDGDLETHAQSTSGDVDTQTKGA